jgi:hypothetical protein
MRLMMILAIFALPLVLAGLMHTGSLRLRPDKTNNLGRFVVPRCTSRWSGLGSHSGFGPTLVGFWVILHPFPFAARVSAGRRLPDYGRSIARPGETGSNPDRFNSDSSSPPALRDEILKIYPRFELASDLSGGFVDALRCRRKTSESDVLTDLYLVDPAGI